MSATPQGPGWWQATDGGWYPPERVRGETQGPPEARSGIGGTAQRTRPEWFDTLVLVSVAAAVVIAATAGLLLWTRPSSESPPAASADAAAEATAPADVTATVLPLPTTVFIAPTTTAYVPPTTALPPTTAPLPDSHRQFLAGVRVTIPAESLPDQVAISQGLNQCRVITDFMAPGEISATLADILIVGVLQDGVSDAAAKQPDPVAAERKLIAITWNAGQHLCPEWAEIVDEAWRGGQ